MFRLQSPVISRTKKHILNEKRHLTDANEIYLKVDLTNKEFKAAIIKKKKKSLKAKIMGYNRIIILIPGDHPEPRSP